MRNSAMLQSQAIAAFRYAPDFSIIDSLHRATPRQQGNFLRWLDQSGLALYFLHRLSRHKAADRLPAQFRVALDHRQASNRARTTDMLEEFRRIVTSFSVAAIAVDTSAAIPFCALKGFSLTPDFCSAPHLRHQTDFDFLVAPEFLPQAVRTLESLGYAQTELRSTGQLTFATPLRHVPSAADDIYTRPRHREVDLLPSLSLDFHGAVLHTPSDQLARGHRTTLGDLSFPVLAADDAFSLQVLHTFSHFLGSWIRLSWLIEIAAFLETHRDNVSLWHSVIRRNTNSSAGIATTSHPNTNLQAFSLILSLTQHLFATPIPQLLYDWCVLPQVLPAPIAAWAAQFGQRFALAPLDGSKLTLFVHRQFIPDRRAWHAYLLARLFPLGRRSSIGSVSTAAPGARIRAQVSQWLHSMRRALFHARELVSLPMDFIRWKRALHAVRGQRVLAPQQSDSQRVSTRSGATLTGLARLPDESR